MLYTIVIIRNPETRTPPKKGLLTESLWPGVWDILAGSSVKSRGLGVKGA